MSEQQQVRRRPDGSVDFDFYRRSAAHERSLAIKAVMRRSLASIQRASRAALVLIGDVPPLLGGLRTHRVARSEKS
jgi:hypothetical protein